MLSLDTGGRSCQSLNLCCSEPPLPRLSFNPNAQHGSKRKYTKPSPERVRRQAHKASPNKSCTSPNPAYPTPASRQNSSSHNHAAPVNGAHYQSQRGKKKPEQPVDPATMYESLKNRIAALEEEEVIEEEEERRFGECVRGCRLPQLNLHHLISRGGT